MTLSTTAKALLDEVNFNIGAQHREVGEKGFFHFVHTQILERNFGSELALGYHPQFDKMVQIYLKKKKK